MIHLDEATLDHLEDVVRRSNIHHDDRRGLYRLIDARRPNAVPWSAEECERQMRNMTNGRQGCSNPAEHTP